MRRGPRRRRRGVRRGPVRARSCTWNAGSPWTRWSRPYRKGSVRAASGAGAAHRSECGHCSRPCGRRRAAWRSRSSPSGGAIARCAGSTSPGAEAGYPPDPPPRRVPSRDARGLPPTIHAGEAFGLPSIWEALQLCGAERLGHGVRIVDDIEHTADGPVAGSSRRVGARPPCAAGAVPDVQRALGRGALDRRASHRAAVRSSLPGDAQHRQPADVVDLRVERDASLRRCVRLGPGAAWNVSRSMR